MAETLQQVYQNAVTQALRQMLEERLQDNVIEDVLPFFEHPRGAEGYGFFEQKEIPIGTARPGLLRKGALKIGDRSVESITKSLKLHLEDAMPDVPQREEWLEGVLEAAANQVKSTVSQFEGFTRQALQHATMPKKKDRPKTKEQLVDFVMDDTLITRELDNLPFKITNTLVPNSMNKVFVALDAVNGAAVGEALTRPIKEAKSEIEKAMKGAGYDMPEKSSKAVANHISELFTGHKLPLLGNVNGVGQAFAEAFKRRLGDPREATPTTEAAWKALTDEVFQSENMQRFLDRKCHEVSETFHSFMDSNLADAAYPPSDAGKQGRKTALLGRMHVVEKALSDREKARDPRAAAAKEAESASLAENIAAQRKEQEASGKRHVGFVEEERGGGAATANSAGEKPRKANQRVSKEGGKGFVGEVERRRREEKGGARIPE